MKKLLIALFVLSTFALQAQITGSQLFVSGTLGLNTSGSSSSSTTGGTTVDVDGVSTFGFDISPKVGYLLTDKFGVGLGVGYDYSQTRTPDFFDNGTDVFDQVEKDGSFFVSPFARYYQNLANKFYLYGELSVPVSFISYKELMWNDDFSNVIDSDVKDNALSFGTALGLGANYFLNDMIALEARFNILGFYINSYTTTVEQDNGDKVESNYSSVVFDVNTYDLINFSNLTIGVLIFL
jgi:outer membrane immunogenic protein